MNKLIHSSRTAENFNFSKHVHHSRSRQLIFLFAPSFVFANKRLLVASESSMLLPTALAQTFKDSLLQNSKGNSALINGPSPSWHSLPILFQTNSFVGIKSRTKTRSCWTRPGNCPGDHPRWGDQLDKRLNLKFFWLGMV